MAFELIPVFAKLGTLSTSNHASVASMNLFVALLCSCIVIGHLLEKTRWMNESITALIIGLCTGLVILFASGGKSSHLLVFSEDLFFIYLLPPIIFNAGFQVKKKQFFRNFITIVLFGAIGTIICWFVISLGVIEFFKRMDIGYLDIGDCLAIGAIFAATDSVCTLQVLNQDETPLLYSLVFGEGVVNDATSVVLFNALQGFDITNVNPTIVLHFIGNFLYLFFASTALGVLTGLLSAYTIKKLYFGRHSTDREIALMILMAYMSYMMAELFNFSGILTVFFCGIVMSHYTWHNVTESSRITTKHAFATLSFIAETFIFVYVGMDALDIEKWEFASESPGTSVAVSSLLLGLVLVGRAAFVYPLSFLSNLAKKSPTEKINFKQQVVIWWAGLMRGAVSMALAYKKFTTSGHTQLRGNATMITSTITVVLFSTVVTPLSPPLIIGLFLASNFYLDVKVYESINTAFGSFQVFGLLTKPLIRLLLPPKQPGSSISSSGYASPSSLSATFLEVDPGGHHSNDLGLLLATPRRSVHGLWRKFDDAFMRPMFGGRGFVPCSPTELNGTA